MHDTTPIATQQPITRLLHDARGGDADALERLYSAVYEELKVIARARLRGRGAPATLNPTALVHEAFLRLIEGSALNVLDRAHFYALSSRAMRHVLVDHFRRRAAKKRSSDEIAITLLQDEIPNPMRGHELLALDEALERLRRVDSRLAQVVDYRFFGGLTELEIARVLNVSDRTVRNDWRKARAWLTRALRSEDADDERRGEDP